MIPTLAICLTLVALAAIVALTYVVRRLLVTQDSMSRTIVAKQNCERTQQAGHIFNAGYAEHMAHSPDIWRDPAHVGPQPDPESEPEPEEVWHTMGTIPIPEDLPQSSDD